VGRRIANSPVREILRDDFSLGKVRQSALNAFDLPCKWPPNGYTQGVSVAFIPKNG